MRALQTFLRAYLASPPPGSYNTQPEKKQNSHVDTGDTAVRLTPSTTHTLLQPIRTGTRQHLVDTDNVERVDTDAHVERFLAGRLDNVLVGANTGGFQRLGRELFVFVRNQVAAEGEVVDGCALAAEIVDSDLGVGDTTVVPRLGEPVSLVSGSVQRCHIDARPSDLESTPSVPLPSSLIAMHPCSSFGRPSMK